MGCVQIRWFDNDYWSCIAVAAEELSLLDEKTMFDAVETQGMQVNWKIMQLSEEIDSLIQAQYLWELLINKFRIITFFTIVGMICCNFCITKIVSMVD